MKNLKDISTAFETFKSDDQLQPTLERATQLSNPDLDNVSTWLKYYTENYKTPQLESLSNLLERLSEIRNTLELNLDSLEITIGSDELFKGLEVLKIIIKQVLDWHQSADSFTDSQAIHFYHTESCEWCLSKIHEHLENWDLEQQKQVILSDFEMVWNIFENTMEDLTNSSNLKQNIQTLQEANEAFLKRHNIHESEVETRWTKPGMYLGKFEYKTDTIPLREIGNQMLFIKRLIAIADDLAKFLDDLERHKPTPEMMDQIEKDRLEYGAKAAHKIFLEKVIKRSEESEAFFGVELMPSMPVTTKIYDKWATGENIDLDLHKVYQQSVAILKEFNTERPSAPFSKVLIRSSVVHSEDGLKTTGAGAYESVDVSLESFESFKKGVEIVFGSVNTPEAIAEQKKLGIEQESSGLLIEPFVEKSYKLQANSTKPRMPKFAEVFIGTHKSLPNKGFFKKSHIPLDIIDYHKLSASFMFSTHTNIDWKDLFDEDHKNCSTMRVSLILRINFIFEHYFQQGVQLEFLTHIQDPLLQWRTITAQLRCLPELDPIEPPAFPSIPHLYKGRGTGMGTKHLQKSNCYIGDSSYGASIGKNKLNPSQVSQYEAVIMTRSFDTDGGHIEQQCVEKNIFLVTNDPLEPMDFPQELPEKFTIVCDGMEARIYETKSFLQASNMADT